MTLDLTEFIFPRSSCQPIRLKSEMVKSGKMFYWCKTCDYNKKERSADSYKPEDCWREKKEENSGESAEELAEGNIVLEMIEGGFLAIIWLLSSMLLGKILDEEEYLVLFSRIEACYAMTIYCVYFKLLLLLF